MTTVTSANQLDGVAISELATGPDPARWHEALRSLGTHARHDGQWIVSTPPDVVAALAAPTLRVVPPLAGAGPAADLIATMARFSDGDAHRRRRGATLRLLPPVAEVAAWAADRAARYLGQTTAADAFDIMPLARMLPAEVLARAMGLIDADAVRAAEITGRLCDAIALGVTARAVADQAARELCETLRPLAQTDSDELAASASILFQARDATAALIGASVLESTAHESLPTAVRVQSALRRQAPVQCTRRTAAADTTIGAAPIPRGASVWIFMAAAEPGNGTPATFGSGPHGCPGGPLASAIAREVVTALDAGGWRPVAGQPVDYEPRPNLRLARRVLVSRR